MFVRLFGRSTIMLQFLWKTLKGDKLVCFSTILNDLCFRDPVTQIISFKITRVYMPFIDTAMFVRLFGHSTIMLKFLWKTLILDKLICFSTILNELCFREPVTQIKSFKITSVYMAFMLLQCVSKILVGTEFCYNFCGAALR
jgi:hypothetical protein